ncbi:hypothetical protein B0O99DRAFT_259523 [Bisporella sp. PMI_857]|nr:hypothetical protein B0O99DRAFT_259523 [Bisporella sp. PMI_857]
MQYKLSIVATPQTWHHVCDASCKLSPSPSLSLSLSPLCSLSESGSFILTATQPHIGGYLIRCPTQILFHGILELALTRYVRGDPNIQRSKEPWRQRAFLPFFFLRKRQNRFAHAIERRYFARQETTFPCSANSLVPLPYPQTAGPPIDLVEMKRYPITLEGTSGIGLRFRPESLYTSSQSLTPAGKRSPPELMIIRRGNHVTSSADHPSLRRYTLHKRMTCSKLRNVPWISQPGGRRRGGWESHLFPRERGAAGAIVKFWTPGPPPSPPSSPQIHRSGIVAHFRSEGPCRP